MAGKSILITIVLCLLSFCNYASAYVFGGPWAHQMVWHDTSSFFCDGGATNIDSNDWYDPECWGTQEMGMENGVPGTGLCPYYPQYGGSSDGIPDWTTCAAMQPRGNCAILQWSPFWPGQDANGYDAYASQILLMPWSWDGASNFVMTIGPEINVNSGRLIGVGYPNPYLATWEGSPPSM